MSSGHRSGNTCFTLLGGISDGFTGKVSRAALARLQYNRAPLRLGRFEGSDYCRRRGYL